MSQDTNKPSLPSTLYTEEYFLNACEGYEEFVESQGERLSRRLSEAFAYAEVKPGMKVLDVGCGRGEILRHVTKLGARAYGVDYAEVAVKLSREATRDEPTPIGVYRTDAKRLPYPNGTFDRILMFDVVEHLFPWELDASLKDIQRVLKPQGMIVVHTAPNRWYDQYAYPIVRGVRRLQGKKYPANPRALNVEAERRSARQRTEHRQPGTVLEARRFYPGESVAQQSATAPQRKHLLSRRAARVLQVGTVPLVL